MCIRYGHQTSLSLCQCAQRFVEQNIYWQKCLNGQHKQSDNTGLLHGKGKSDEFSAEYDVKKITVGKQK